VTGSSARPRGEEWYLLMTAATDEAARAGHGEVDVDHVLLALLVTGGASAGVLADAGLQLGAARTALAEVQWADLADSSRPSTPGRRAGDSSCSPRRSRRPPRRTDRRTALRSLCSARQGGQSTSVQETASVRVGAEPEGRSVPSIC
jgi:hypothetical protein